MKTLVNTLMVVLLATLLLSVVSVGQRESEDPLLPAVDSKLYKACGLDRLSESERANIYRVFQCRSNHSYLEEGAVRYMEKNNWGEVAVNGTVELQLGIDPYPKPYLIAYARGTSYLLEPSLTQSEFPMPGVYFGKIEGSRWRIVEKRGDVVDYWIKSESE
jgi:hypothetical protein